MQKILWLETHALDSSENMAVDEALFLERAPSLRFYDWKESAYSMGYFQCTKAFNPAVTLVRRITGGGIVKHGEDLTFSLVIDLQKFPVLECVKESYFFIHQGILEGFKILRRPLDVFLSKRERSEKYCFNSPVPGDLMLGDVKVVGGAQRRRGSLLLHQGTIQLPLLDVERLAVIRAIGEGFEKLFRLDFEEDSGILGRISSSIKDLKAKYSSQVWTYKF